MPALAQRLANVKVSASVAMGAKARELAAQGHKVISLTTGEPDFDTPAHRAHPLYRRRAAQRNAETARQHAEMGFHDGWGTVATQLESYAQGLMK